MGAALNSMKPTLASINEHYATLRKSAWLAATRCVAPRRSSVSGRVDVWVRLAMVFAPRLGFRGGTSLDSFVWVKLGILVEVFAGPRFSYHSSPLSERTNAPPCGTITVYSKLILLSLRGRMWGSAGECGKRQIEVFELGAFNRALPPLRLSTTQCGCDVR